MICFDWAFPEMARVLSLGGRPADPAPSNLVLPYCMQAMLTRSIENRVFTATANRTGLERSTLLGQLADHLAAGRAVGPGRRRSSAG